MDFDGRLLASLLAFALATPALGQSAASADGGAPVESAPADQEPDSNELESLLAERVGSAASLTAQTSSDAPGTTWTISGTDLKRFGIQSVEEALRYLGHGMTSYESDTRLNPVYGARGYSSNNLGLHLAVLINGNQAGASSKTSRGGQAYQMPIELVDHLEVVLGPGSVIYGNSAMLGIVNVVTRTGASLSGAHAVAQGSLGLASDAWAKDASWGEAWARAAVYGGTTFQAAGQTLDLSVHFALRWDRQQGRSIWRLNTPGADLFADGAFFREDVFNRELSTRLFAQALWGRWAFRAWGAFRYSAGAQAIAGSGKSSSTEPELGLDVTWARPVGDRGDFSLRGYLVLFDSQGKTFDIPANPTRCVDAVGSPDCFDTLRYFTFRPYVEPTFRWDWRRDGSQVTTLGAQLFLDGAIILQGTTATDGGRSTPASPSIAPLPNGAIFGQHILSGRLGVLNLGARLDVGFLGWSVSPRVAYSKGLWREGTLKAAFATGFRTPTLTERFLEVPNFLVPNPNLTAERVYSGELDLAQRLGLQNLQLSVFFTHWEGIINTRFVPTATGQAYQFANLRRLWSAGLNFGWQGGAGPAEWGLSVNYAPGRVSLPAGVADFSDAQLREARLTRNAVSRFGTTLFGETSIPVDSMPDFYATAHVSVALGSRLPRLSVAACLNSPRLLGGYATDVGLTDPRNVAGPVVPWTVEVRGAAELPVGDRVGLRAVVTGRSGRIASTTRVGESAAPVPSGGIGVSSNPVAPLSAMLEVNVRL